MIRIAYIVAGCMALCTGLSAQESPAAAPAQLDRSNYVLGPDDQIVIRASEAEDISHDPILIGSSGFVTLPMLGRIKASGLTIDQLEADLTERMTKFVKVPDVSVTLVGMRSQPVSVIGEVKSPGVHQLQGSKTLVEILSLAGGLNEDAGYSAKITREIRWGRIPLPNATDDATGQYSVAEVPLHNIMTANSPAQNIAIMPDDVISVPKAQLVYVIGDVNKPGEIVLGDQESVTVLKALSLASGMTKTAKPKMAKILRQEPGQSTRQEVVVDLKLILEGKSSDLPMKAEDILFVPSSAEKTVAIKALESVLQVGTGIAIISAH